MRYFGTSRPFCWLIDRHINWWYSSTVSGRLQLSACLDLQRERRDRDRSVICRALRVPHFVNYCSYTRRKSLMAERARLLRETITFIAAWNRCIANRKATWLIKLCDGKQRCNLKNTRGIYSQKWILSLPSKGIYAILCNSVHKHANKKRVICMFQIFIYLAN
jgi:hypothetical protein